MNTRIDKQLKACTFILNLEKPTRVTDVQISLKFTFTWPLLIGWSVYLSQFLFTSNKGTKVGTFVLVCAQVHKFSSKGIMPKSAKYKIWW